LLFCKKILTKRFDSEGISFEEKDSSSQYKCMNGYKRRKEKERERQREGGRGHMYKDIGCAKTSNGWTQSVNLNSLCLYNFCLFTSKPFSHFQDISFLPFAPLLCLWETFLFSFCVYNFISSCKKFSLSWRWWGHYFSNNFHWLNNLFLFKKNRLTIRLSLFI